MHGATRQPVICFNARLCCGCVSALLVCGAEERKARPGRQRARQEEREWHSKPHRGYTTHVPGNLLLLLSKIVVMQILIHFCQSFFMVPVWQYGSACLCLLNNRGPRYYTLYFSSLSALSFMRGLRMLSISFGFSKGRRCGTSLPINSKDVRFFLRLSTAAFCHYFQEKKKTVHKSQGKNSSIKLGYGGKKACVVLNYYNDYGHGRYKTLAMLKLPDTDL